ncbi:MAG TPA: serine hydrolase domain-containing protein [Rudaea sp.]|nr:serine hydrolase domain-containing protein [Rudaea sp.]
MFHLRTPAVLALLTLVVHAVVADARDVREKWIHRSAEQGVHVSANPKAVAKDFAAWMDQIEQSGQISGMAAAIVKDDTVLLQRGIGYADAARGEHVSVDSPFRLASLSKAFASALTAMLVDEGMLDWDTRVAGVLPTFELKNIEASDKLTVRDILSQRVGLPHNTYDRLLEQDEPYEELVEKLRDVPMTCDVGECYGYQNITFALIGDITYAVSGDFFYHQVEKRIFHPLGMNDATYGRVALEASKDWARPHARRGHGWVPIPIKEAYYHVPAAAGVNASIKDMTQWLIAQMGERPDVLPSTLLATVHTPLVETPSERHATPWRRARLDDAQYALGWRVYDYAGQTLIYHAGAVQGYRSMIAFFPKYRFGAVMLWNCECALPSGLMPMLLDRYLGLHQVDWAGLESLRQTRHALTASNRR